MKLSYKHKSPSTRHIHYSESNDEPLEHQLGKQRIRGILMAMGYEIVVNTDKHEYQLRPYHNIIGDMERQYTIDAMGYDKKYQSLRMVEVDGKYHFASKEKIKHLKLKKEIATLLFEDGEKIMIENRPHDVKEFRYVNFKTEELIGKDRLEGYDVEHRINGGHVMDLI